jgi:hypothetical protein
MDVLVSGQIGLRNVGDRHTLTTKLVDRPIDFAGRNNTFMSLEIAPRRIPSKFRTCIVNNYWFIAIKKRGEDIYNLDNLTILQSPPGHFWADPFLAGQYLFFEDYDYEKGIISVGELDGLTLKNVRPVLDEPEHVSFPSVLHHDGDWYMTPERHNARLLRVYRATAFPDRWEPLVNVARGRFDDPLLRKTERGFEIWATKADVLHVFEAKHIAGPWRLIRTHTAPFQRSAGNFIGDIRPTQDTQPVYGRAIKFLRGDEVVRTIEPTWYPNLTGTHTFNVSETHVVIDGRIPLENPPHPGRAKRRRRLHVPRWLRSLMGK